MGEHIVLFHSALGLTPGLREFADRLRAAGHTVNTPDLFDGAVFGTLEEGEPPLRGSYVARLRPRRGATHARSCAGVSRGARRCARRRCLARSGSDETRLGSRCRSCLASNRVLRKAFLQSVERARAVILESLLELRPARALKGEGPDVLN